MQPTFSDNFYGIVFHQSSHLLSRSAFPGSRSLELLQRTREELPGTGQRTEQQTRRRAYLEILLRN